MNKLSALGQIRQHETTINAVLRLYHLHDLDKNRQKLIAELKRDLVDAKLDIRDAEYADTRAEYARHAAAAKKRIVQVIDHILALSQFNIFSPVEVAELSAKFEQLRGDL
ncbi:MAG: hypothetical protein NVS1B7_2470 [Candidatus Saccharimonadales bacterium]